MFMTTAMLHAHLLHLASYPALLEKSASEWTKADRKRAELTLANLGGEIERINGELAMARARFKKVG